MSYKNDTESYLWRGPANPPVQAKVRRRRVHAPCPTTHDLAYIAGLIDGDGCIHIAKQQQPGRPRPTYRARVTLAQSNYELLCYVRDVLGEPSYLHKVPRTLQQNRQHYTLVYDGRHALAVIAKLLRWLRAKAPEARVLLEYGRVCAIHTHSGPQGHSEEIWRLRESYYLKLRRMK